MDGNVLGAAASRRQFIVTGLTAAGGLAIGIGPALAVPIAAQPRSPEAADAHEMNAWLVMICPDWQ